jgi:hypothetical protein
VQAAPREAIRNISLLKSFAADLLSVRWTHEYPIPCLVVRWEVVWLGIGYRVAVEALISAGPTSQAGAGSQRKRVVCGRRVSGRRSRSGTEVRVDSAAVELLVAVEASISTRPALHRRGRRVLVHGGARVNARAT